MKLLTPTETINDKEFKLAVNTKRSADLDKELERKRKELIKINLEFEIAIEKQRAALENEKCELLRGINALKEEIQLLEGRKKDALIPLTERWKELEQAEKIVKGKEEELSLKNEQLSEKLEILEEKLEDLAEKEELALKTAQKQAVAQEGIDNQKEQVSAQQKAFNAIVVNSVEESKLIKMALSRKEAELKLREQNIKAKEDELNEKEAGFRDREKQINDKYATLQRTIDRMKYGIQA